MVREGFTNYGGYLVINKDKKLTVCGKSAKGGQIGVPACDDPAVQSAHPQAMQLALLGQPQGAKAETQVAVFPFIALAVASVTCAGAGFVGASLHDQKNSILTQDATEQAQAAIMFVTGTSTALKPAGAIARIAAPRAAALMVGGVTTTAGLAVAICAASAGAGYGIFHFFFKGKSDIGPPAK